MKSTNLRRHVPEVRVALANAIAAEFETQLLYVRSVEPNGRESDLPLTDLNSDGDLLARLAAALDGYDFESTEEDEAHCYRFYVHLLAAAMCPLITDGHDLNRALEDAKAVLRRRRDQEQEHLSKSDGCTETRRLHVPMFGAERFESL